MLLGESLAYLIVAASGDVPTPDPASSTAPTIALYAMISAIAVAVIGVIGSLLLARYNNRGNHNSNNQGRGNASQRVTREHEAWERWLLLNGLDPRKIRTGYETPDEVRRVTT